MDVSAIIKYFSLNEHPFMTSPDPRFLYFSSQVKEALAKCEFMARDRIGPIYMYGPIGSGKTSLVRRLQEKLGQDERYNVKLLISPNLKSANAFLRLILETFDVKTERSYTASLANFEKFLVAEYQAGRVPVLLIDEAQYLNRDQLKLIHYLLNFETNKTKLLQIVLVGQEELGTKIIHYRELASRMFPIAMNAMSLDDLRDMITFRLNVPATMATCLPIPTRPTRRSIPTPRACRATRSRYVLSCLSSLPPKAKNRRPPNRLRRLRRDRTFACKLWADLTY